VTQVIEVCRAIAFGAFAHLELRNELAKILITRARFAEQWKPRRFALVLVRHPRRRLEARTETGYRNLCAYVCTNIVAFPAGMKTC